ncbi:MAG TPA: sulfur transferase domain-containing protein [Thermoanaerobaculia bacterium]|nr:sulfur transferase domain-containing protein [Thermoanaerobaculia bacterium]
MTASQPTGEQLQLLAEDGFKSIIDLRAEDEPRGYDEPEAARQNGLAYVNIPVNLNVLDEATIDRFLDTMKRVKRPVIIHSSSTNRVGAVYYAWLVLEKKVPPAEAMNRAMAAGLKQSTMIRKVKKLVAEHKPIPEKPAQKPAQE